MNNDKIKVCHIITKLELGGAQQNTLYTVAHLDRARFKPVLIAGKGGILDAEAQALSDVPVHFSASLIRSVNPFTDIASFFELYRLIRKEKPDIVHTHSSKAGIVGRWAAWLARVPAIVHTFHGFGFNDFQPWPVRAAFIFSEWLTAKITDRLIVVADEDRRRGLSLKIGDPRRYILIRSGIDLSKFKEHAVDRDAEKKALGIPAGAMVVTTVGPFKPQKNLADFIRVAALVKKEVPDSRFLVVGDGEQRQILEALIEENNLKDTVTLLGWRRDCADILSVSNVFAMTSLWEGLPRSILEAMSTALPVVANAVDGVREIIKDGETGYRVEPFALEKMAGHIIGLLRNPSLAKAMGEKGRNSIDRQFDITYMVRQQETLYLELVK
jgi:glycosyltransferase involved in cell wall biosynthesis